MKNHGSFDQRLLFIYLLIHGDIVDVQAKEFCGCQQVTEQKQLVLDSFAGYVVTLFGTHDRGHDHFEPAGQGFDQDFVIIQQQYQLPILNINKISFL